MPAKKEIAQDNPVQSEAFIKKAKELKADETGQDFERAMRAITKKQTVTQVAKSKSKPKKTAI